MSVNLISDEAPFIDWLELTATDTDTELIFWEQPFVDGKEFGATIFG